MKFQVDHRDPATRARTGRVEVRGKTFETPVFMPVGTAATVKGVRPEDVRNTGMEILLCNTYHLHLRPGEEVIRKIGGLHDFMGWHGAILTDSGGYQVFSLADLVKVDDEGVEFKSHIDGDRIGLTPEKVMEIQGKLGSDIAMVLDHCVPYPSPEDEAARAVERTRAWAERSLQARDRLAEGGAVFGIIQGSTYEALRKLSAQQIVSLDFDGIAVGGLSVGEGKRIMRQVMDWIGPMLPEEKPHYLMGVGDPDDILDAVAEGVDMFDCVLPTRNARNSTLFTRTGQLKLRNAALKDDPRPPEEGCGCPLCRNYSRAYIRHLFNAREMLGPILATLHNLRFFQDLMAGIRAAIRRNEFDAFRRNFLDRYNGNPA